MPSEKVVTPKSQKLTNERFWKLWNEAETPVEHLLLFRGYHKLNERILLSEAEAVDPSSSVPYIKAAADYRSFALGVATEYDRFVAEMDGEEGHDYVTCTELRDTALMYAMERCIYVVDRYSNGRTVTINTECQAEVESILRILAYGSVFQQKAPIENFGSDPYKGALKKFFEAIAQSLEGLIVPTATASFDCYLAMILANYFQLIDRTLRREDKGAYEAFVDIVSVARYLKKAQAPDRTVAQILNRKPPSAVELKKLVEKLLPSAARWEAGPMDELLKPRG